MSSDASINSPCQVCVVGSSKRAIASVVRAMEEFTAGNPGICISARVAADSNGAASPDFAKEVLQGCSAYVLCGDGSQSRLLVSNTARDTATTHEILLEMLRQRTAGQLRGEGVVLAIIGGATRGFLSPDDAEIWSDSVESVLRKTGQTVALQLVDAQLAVSWTGDKPSLTQMHKIASSLQLLPQTPDLPQTADVFKTSSAWGPIAVCAAGLSVVVLAGVTMRKQQRKGRGDLLGDVLGILSGLTLVSVVCASVLVRRRW